MLKQLNTLILFELAGIVAGTGMHDMRKQTLVPPVGRIDRGSYRQFDGHKLILKISFFLVSLFINLWAVPKAGSCSDQINVNE